MFKRLNETQIVELNVVQRTGDFNQRKQAHAIKLWGRKIKIDKIAQVEDETEDTIKLWIQSYKSLGVKSII